MEITKGNWSLDGSNLSVTVPFAKVDQENRLVSGFATLDNIDRVGDVMLAEASNAAFERFRGNVREMHQSIAVGRVLSFTQEDFYDVATDRFYRGVFVTVYVSKGAQDTWEKVLDGTLSAFSIGGIILDADVVYDPETERTIRVVKEYDLIELSLVDSPCNTLANVFSVTKSDAGVLVFKGMAFEVETSNVFFCSDERIAVVSSSETVKCTSCGNAMENIGWIETADAGKPSEISKVVQKYLSPAQAEATHEGGIEVSEIATSVEEVEPIVEKADAVVEEAAVEEAVVADEAEVVEEAAEDAAVEEAADEVEVEKADEGSDVGAEAPDFVKMFDDLKTFVSEVVNENVAKSAEQVDGIRASVDEFVKSVDSKFVELDTTYKSLAETVGKIEKSISDMEARVESLNSSTAVKKSSELGGSETGKKQSIWGGHFLGVTTLDS